MTEILDILHDIVSVLAYIVSVLFLLFLIVFTTYHTMNKAVTIKFAVGKFKKLESLMTLSKTNKHSIDNLQDSIDRLEEWNRLGGKKNV